MIGIFQHHKCLRDKVFQKIYQHLMVTQESGPFLLVHLSKAQVSPVTAMMKTSFGCKSVSMVRLAMRFEIA